MKARIRAVSLGLTLGCALVCGQAAANATPVSDIDASSSASSAAAATIADTTPSPALKTYEARYQARAMGLSATAYRSLTLEGEQYQLQNSLTLTLLGATVGSVTETSTFALKEGDVTPLQYRYEQTGVGARSEQVDFDWPQKMANSVAGDRSWMLPLTPGVMDRLSFSLQLGRDIDGSANQEFSYQLIDRNEIDIHLYRVTAEEVVTTPVGNINTLRIERVREADSNRHTVVWLARDWGNMLVKLEQVNSSGMRTELTLESATVDGQPLISSPQ